MKLNARLLIRRILDNTQETLERTLPYQDRLIDHPVSPEPSWRRHATATAAAQESRVHL